MSVALQIKIQEKSTDPTYKQIADQIRTMINDGMLAPGTTLPTVRKLAKEIGVSNFTVLHAFGILQQQGLIESVVGRGTIVARSIFRLPSSRIVGRSEQIGPLNTYEDLSESAGVVSLATSIPDPHLFDQEEFWKEMDYIRNSSPWIFYYAQPSGLPEFKLEIQKQLRNIGVGSTLSELVITGGSTHAVSLLIQELMEPNECLLVGNPSYLSSEVFYAQQRVVPIPIKRDENEFDIEDFKSKARLFRARYMLIFATHDSPAGWSLTEKGRRELLAAAEEMGVVIIDNNCYGDILLEGEAMPPLASMASIDRVIHVGSYSYNVSPGIRSGYIRANNLVCNAISERIRLSMVTLPKYVQMALSRYFMHGRLEKHLAKVLPIYKERRAATLSALDANLPEGSTRSNPLGGFAVWVSLPDAYDTTEIYSEAIRHGVSFVPGKLFYGSSNHSNKLRISYGLHTTEELKNAVEKLCDVIKNSPKA